MKRLVAFLLVFLQLLSIVSVSYPLCRNVFDGVAAELSRTSLLTIICDNTIASILKLAEAVNLVETAQAKETDKAPARDDSDTKTTSIPPSSRLSFDSKTAYGSPVPGSFAGGVLLAGAAFNPKLLVLLLLISCLCFCLFRKKMHYLKPRGALDDLIVFFLQIRTHSPSFAGQNEGFSFIAYAVPRRGTSNFLSPTKERK